MMKMADRRNTIQGFRLDKDFIKKLKDRNENLKQYEGSPADIKNATSCVSQPTRSSGSAKKTPSNGKHGSKTRRSSHGSNKGSSKKKSKSSKKNKKGGKYDSKVRDL